MKRCDRYRDWLNDAALGELAPGREPELLAHAAECDACREAYANAREVRAFVDRGVESLVSGEPSRHFNSRLRARIATEASSPRLTWRPWAPVAASAIALVVLLAVFVPRSPVRHSAAPAPEIAGTPPSYASPNNPRPGSHEEPSSRSSWASTSRSTIPRHKTVHPSNSQSEPEVLVPRGQLAAVMQFADAIRSGRINGPQLLAAQKQLDAPIEIKPIEITPLSPPQPDLPNDAPSAAPTDPTRP